MGNIFYKIVDNFEKLNKNLSKSNSLKFNFLIGLMRGLGTAIGATIVAAILISILAKTIDSVQDVPFIDKFIENIDFNTLEER